MQEETLTAEDIEWVAQAVRVLEEDGYEVIDVSHIEKEYGEVKFDIGVQSGSEKKEFEVDGGL